MLKINDHLQLSNSLYNILYFLYLIGYYIISSYLIYLLYCVIIHNFILIKNLFKFFFCTKGKKAQLYYIIISNNLPNNGRGIIQKFSVLVHTHIRLKMDQQMSKYITSMRHKNNKRAP